MNRTKLTPLGRLILFILILSVGAIAGAAGAAATRPHAQAWRCIAVRPGETLWTLAGRTGSADRRAAVYRIVEQNRLHNQTLRAGSSVWVPNEGNLAGLVTTPSESCPEAY